MENKTHTTTEALVPEFQSDYLDIFIDHQNNWYYANWKGVPTEKVVVDGLDAMMAVIEKYGLSKWLNDNRQVKGTWTGSMDYVVNHWMPKAMAKGVRAIAFIYAHDVFAKFSVNAFIKANKESPLQQLPFNSRKEAETWLTNL